MTAETRVTPQGPDPNAIPIMGLSARGGASDTRHLPVWPAERSLDELRVESAFMRVFDSAIRPVVRLSNWAILPLWRAQDGFRFRSIHPAA